jgi:hypothetical protein
MQKLTKEQVARKRELVDKLSGAGQELQAAIIAYNEKCEAEFSSVREAIDDYQTVVDEARSFAEEIAGDIAGYMDEKSEKWLESDRGQAFEQWKSEWENIDIYDVDLDEPTPIGCDVDEMAGTPLDEMQEEVYGS